MNRQLKQLKFDRRLQSFFLKSGELTQAELDSHLSSLKDSEPKAQQLGVFSEAQAESSGSQPSPESLNGEGGHY